MVDITDEMRENAKRESDKYKDNVTRSLLYGEGTYAGCLGEEMFHKVFPFMKRFNTRHYDFIYEKDDLINLKFDIKTKQRSVPPMLHYDCSVNELNGKQELDYYVFAQVMTDFERGWLLGTMKSETYFKKARFIKKGEVDPSNNFKSLCDMWNIPISSLRPMKVPEEFRELAKKRIA